jgi:ADP-heptose:LPS heptosyltransferase
VTADLRNILVIKLSALGDFVLAMGPCAAIRRDHANARITLLTTAPYAEFAAASGYFDDVWIDDRPRWWQAGTWLALKRRLDNGLFGRVYDLQTSDRSGTYFRLMGRPKPEWNGIAPGCSHPHDNPRRDFMHTIERQREQLAAAGIDDVPPPNFEWIDDNIDQFGVPAGFVLLVPGGSAGRPAKRWPTKHYIDLATTLSEKDRVPVLIGAGDEAKRNAAIADACPRALNLTGGTSLSDITRLARAAAGAIGNDNGPMHLISAVGCPSVVVYSSESDPALCAQRGPDVTILRRDNLADIEPDEVEAAIRLR